VSAPRALEPQDGRALLIYSEGFLLSPRLVVLGDHYQRIVDRCRRANVALFVADPSGLRPGLGTAEAPTALGPAGPTGSGG
jgi:hypothetical protein